MFLGIQFGSTEQIIQFNRKKLGEEMVKISDNMHQYKEDPFLPEILALLRIGRDIAILDCSDTSNVNDLIKIQAKIAVFNEIRSFIISSIDRKQQEAKEGKKAVRGSFNTFKRVNNQAEASI